MSRNSFVLILAVRSGGAAYLGRDDQQLRALDVESRDKCVGVGGIGSGNGVELGRVEGLRELLDCES